VVVLQREAEALAQMGDISQVDERCALVGDLEGRLAASSELAALYNSREEIFMLPRSEYPQIEAITKYFEPYGQVWKVGGWVAADLVPVLLDVWAAILVLVVGV
jgi:hypothetical protein